MFGSASKEDVRAIVREHEERTMATLEGRFKRIAEDVTALEKTVRGPEGNGERIAKLEQRLDSVPTFRNILMVVLGGGGSVGAVLIAFYHLATNGGMP